MHKDHRFNNSRYFEPFPFPALEEGELKGRIRELGEKLDAHRKERQASHPGLTPTGMYNVLEKLRAGEPLSDKDRKIHDEGLVSVLIQIHDDLDAAVFEEYGWEDLYTRQGVAVILPPDKNPEIAGNEARVAGQQNAAPPWEQELLTRLVALNHERAAEEANGIVRWLRPEYQSPEEAEAPHTKQDEMGLDTPGALTTVETSSSPPRNSNGQPAPPPSSRKSANSSPPPPRTPTPSPPASARRPRQESTRSN